MKTARIVFLISMLPAIGNELAKYIGGTYDALTAGKLVAAFVLAVLTGTVSGLIAVRALNTEPVDPAAVLPKRPDPESRS